MKEIEEIIHLRAERYKLNFIGYKFGVTPNAVQKALTRRCPLYYRPSKVFHPSDLFLEDFSTKFPNCKKNLIETVLAINKHRFKTRQSICCFIPSRRLHS